MLNYPWHSVIVIAIDSFAKESFKGSVKIDITKGTQNGKVMRLQKMGMPVYGKENSFGDLYLKVNVQIPQNLSSKEVKLFEELKKLRG